jgi:uncharacterized protein YoaH (UPF0181 family)
MAANMSREEAAALYAQKVRDLHPDKAVEARLEEYQRDVERRSSSR